MKNDDTYPSVKNWEIGDGYIIEDGTRYVRCKSCNGSGKVEDVPRPSDSGDVEGPEEAIIKRLRQAQAASDNAHREGGLYDAEVFVIDVIRARFAAKTKP